MADLLAAPGKIRALTRCLPRYASSGRRSRAIISRTFVILVRP